MINTPSLRAKFRQERKERGLLLKHLPNEILYTIDNNYVHPSKYSFVENALFLVFLVGVILIGGCVISNPAHADITEEQAVNIIVGEAANQGRIGMICVAEVLRLRNSPKGFYGPTKKHLKQASKKTFFMARRAWFASKSTNYTKGANHFENIKAFGCPSWVKKCVETFRWKDHIFYKEIA